MLSQLDDLMAERKLDGLVVFGPDGMRPVNSSFNYFVGGRYLIGSIFKRRGQAAQLVHGVMERDDAAATGLELVENTRWPLGEVQKQFPDALAARIELQRRMWVDLGMTGRVAVTGVADSGAMYATLKSLEASIPGLEIVCEGASDIVQLAREIKSESEIAEMAAIGRDTCAIVAKVQQFLQQHSVQGTQLVSTVGDPVTIGEVKRLIRRLQLEHRLESPGDPIFAQGRDAGVPHNHGCDDDVLEVGRTIIFDYFPRRANSYFHDMTRTWCLGHAPDHVVEIYNTVRAGFELAVEQLHVGQHTYDCQQQMCAHFESAGFPTLRQNSALREGYIHGLGHGLGLDVHESPGFPTFSDAGRTLVPGLVFTIEPGLYYPSRDLGVRLEDTYVCHPDGSFASLSPYPYDLVVPLGR